MSCPTIETASPVEFGGFSRIFHFCLILLKSLLRVDASTLPRRLSGVLLRAVTCDSFSPYTVRTGIDLRDCTSVLATIHSVKSTDWGHRSIPPFSRAFIALSS